MKKLILLLLILYPFSLFSKPYYSEFHDGLHYIIFHGAIAEEDETNVRIFERRYLEHPNERAYYKTQLEKLGVVIEVIRDTSLHGFHPLHRYHP